MNYIIAGRFVYLYKKLKKTCELSYGSYIHHKRALMFITILYDIVDSLTIQFQYYIIYIYIKKTKKEQKKRSL